MNNICTYKTSYFSIILAFISLFLSNDMQSQTLCNPPIPVNAGTDITIPCGGSANIGEVPSPTPSNPDYTLAATCKHTARFQSNSLTQGGGIYINDVTTTGGNINISNTNTLVDAGHVDPMGPNAWSTIWYSDYSAAHFVEACAGSTFNLNINARSLNNNRPYFCRVWIDWDNSGTFTASEIVYTSPAINTHPNINISNIPIAIPAGQPYGAYRMRIRFKDNAPFVTSDGACTYTNSQGIEAPYAGYTGNQKGSYTFSDEIEDYSVHVNCGNDTGGGNLTYSWTPSETLNASDIPNPVASPSGTTTYTITVTDNVNNCITTDQVTVTVTPVTPTFTNPGPVCEGTNFTLPASSNGITGTWSPAPNNMATTTYTFTPDGGQCAITTQMTVVVNPAVTPGFDNPGPVCSGTSFTLPVTSNNNITGTWSPAINNTQTTTYTFTPDNASCASSTTMIVIIDNQVTPTFTNPGPVCQGTAFTLPATSNNGITGTWSPAVNNTATTTYTFTPDNTGCASSATMTVIIENPIVPVFTNPGPICPGTAFTLPATSTNGITGTWSPAINNTQTTTYTFTPDNTGCAATATMTVAVENQVIPAFTNPGPVCTGTAFTLPETSNNSITGTWSPAINNVQTTTYTFTPDNMGCASSTTMTVAIENQIVPVFTNPGPVCPGTAFTLPATSNNNITGTWSPAINNVQTTTYTFTPYNTGCATSATITVVINSAFEISLSEQISICQGATIPSSIVTATGGTAPYTFTYAVGSGSPVTISSNQSVTTIDLANYPGLNANVPGCYDITISGSAAGSCQTGNIVFTEYLCVHPAPDASFLTNPGNDGVYSFTNTSTGATTYTWNFGDGSGAAHSEHPVHKFSNEDGTAYTVELIAYSDKGCSDTASRVINTEEVIFYVPNAFTPDGDEFNNIFKPVMTSGYDALSYQLEIYNRWGELIFESRNADYGWDGTYKGKIVQDGIYVWKITFKVIYNDDKKLYLGHVNIIK